MRARSARKKKKMKSILNKLLPTNELSVTIDKKEDDVTENNVNQVKQRLLDIFSKENTEQKQLIDIQKSLSKIQSLYQEKKGNQKNFVENDSQSETTVLKSNDLAEKISN